MESNRGKAGAGLTRTPSVHSIKSALKSLALPSMPPTLPLPPIPTKKPSTACSDTTLINSRPATSDEARKSSLGSLSFCPNKPIKYGTGKYAEVELVPQPSDDDEDPLNWPRWKKELNLASLLMMVGLIGAMKTVFMATSGAMASRYDVSYLRIAALTAVPLMVSAWTGMAGTTISKLWGKRPVYLASSVLVFAGSIWNLTAGHSYGSCMGARVLQGLGWGAFDTLVMESIQDTYFEHERNLRVTIYNVLTLATTWGSPLIGGAISQGEGSFTVQFQIISAFFVLAFPLLVLGAPETTFDRSRAAIATTPVFGVALSAPWRPRPTRKEFTLDKASLVGYLKEMRPWSFKGDVSLATCVQAPRALAAPTTILVFLITVLPQCALWGLAAALPELLTPSPMNVRPSVLGALMTGPLVLGSLVVAALYLYRSVRSKFTCAVSSTTLGGGTLLAFVGLLALGLTLHSSMYHHYTTDGGFFRPTAPRDLNLPSLSFQLGLLAAGACAVDATTRPLLARSASFTASSMAVAQRSIGDMHACVIVLRALAAGVFVLAVPHAAAAADNGLLYVAVGLAAAQVVLTLAIVAFWRLCDEAIWKADGRVLGLVDLSMLKFGDGSVFETD